MRVEPDNVNTVVPSFAVAFIITLSIVTVKSSVVAEVFTRVNSSVSPSPTNLSDWISSSKIPKGSNLVFVPSSKFTLPVELSSNWIPPPTILTKPVAAATSVSTVLEVNVTVSPSSYNVPASSTITSLTEPLDIPSITIVAFSLPTASSGTTSLSVWRIPSFVTVVDEMKGCTVKVTETSLEVDTPDIISASVNVPLIGTISMIVTESLKLSLDCWTVRELTTVAVAPDVPPVITWFTTSSPLLPPIDVTLSVVFWPHSPEDALII